MKKPNDILCDTCNKHFYIAGCSCCGQCAPDWDIKDGKFTCRHYEKKKEIPNEKENS